MIGNIQRMQPKGGIEGRMVSGQRQHAFKVARRNGRNNNTFDTRFCSQTQACQLTIAKRRKIEMAVGINKMMRYGGGAVSIGSSAINLTGIIDLSRHILRCRQQTGNKNTRFQAIYPQCKTVFSEDTFSCSFP